MKFDINNYKGNFVMHCKTKKEANDFCEYLDSIGKRWVSGGSYLKNNYWNDYESNIVYIFNEGTVADVEYAKRYNYAILEWSDFMNRGEFTKADLKTGDVVMRRDGRVEIVFLPQETLICPNKDWNRLSDFDDNLNHCYGKDYDIVAVRRPYCQGECRFDAFKLKCGTLVYERKEVEEMTLAEVCKLLGKEIKIVK